MAATIPTTPAAGAPAPRAVSGPLSDAEREVLEPDEIRAGVRVVFDDDGTLEAEDGVVTVGTEDGGAVYRWRCSVCGYVHEAPKPPRWCPLCGADGDSFEPDEDED